jgi:hypothetical protein
VALPTIQKTWQISANNRVVAADKDDMAAYVMLAIKNVLVGFASNPLQIVACSDSTVVPDYWDGVDRWNSYTDLVHATAGNPHSWIVFERADGAQVCIDFTNVSNCNDADFVFSANGSFSGGSNTNRPTAGDACAAFQIGSTGSADKTWFGPYTTDFINDVVFHVWNSSDGLIQRIAIFQVGWNCGFIRFDIMQNAPTGLLKPIFASVRSDVGAPANSDCTTPAQMHGHKQGEFYANSLVADLYTSSIDGGILYGDVWPNMDYGQVPNAVSGELSLTELACLSNTVGARGWKGTCVDVWLTSYAAVQNGYSFPADPLHRDYVCVGSLVLPWTGDCTGMQVA